MLGLVAQKIGMTRLYDAVGEMIPVSVIQAKPAVVVQVKTTEKDGYNALQLGFGDVKEKSLTKPEKGHFEKNKVAARKILKEFRLDDVSSYEVGQEISVDAVFSVGDSVDVSGISKGKGFAGVIKRHGFSRGPETHGSRHHREPGSVGSTGPFRVLKGQRLPGRMGAEQVSVQNLKIVKVDAEEGLIFVKGAVPGARQRYVTVQPAVKQAAVAS